MRLIDVDTLTQKAQEIICTEASYKAYAIMDAILTAPTVDVAKNTKIPNKWISVNDRLPEMSKAVLGYTPHHNNIWAVTMHENGEWYIWSPQTKKYDPDWEGPITHWMPLPEPPKTEK